MKIRLCLLLLPLIGFSSLAHAVPVKIIVLGPDSKPIAGAKLEYFSLDATTAIQAGDIRPTQSVTAEMDGTLAIDIPEPTNPIKTNNVVTILALGRVSAPGFTSKVSLINVGENKFQLGKAGRVHGVITGVDGQPATNAKIRYLGTSPRLSDLRYSNSSGFSPPEVATDARGEWTMDGISTQGFAMFEVEAPNSQTLRFNVNLTGEQNEAVPQTLKRGATIRGRVLDGDGKPLEDTKIQVDDQPSFSVRTDKEGRYTLPGQGIGSHMLLARTESPDWVIPLERIAVTIPENGNDVEAPDIKAEKGVLVTGRLLEKGANTPIANQLLFLSNNSGRQVSTDEQGKFSVRIMAGRVWISPMGGDVTYQDANINREIPADVTTFDLGDLILARGLTLKFDVRTADDKPATDVLLMLKSDRLSTTGRWNAKEKAVSFGGLIPGEYTISGRMGWEIVDSKPIKLGETSPAEPIALRVRKVAVPKLIGTVIDEDGNPLPDATISLALASEGGGTRNTSQTSQKDGTWSIVLEDAKTTPSIRKVEYPGYLQVSGGELSRDGIDWKAAPLVLSRSDAELRGKVVDANGKPVVEARISWAGAPETDLVSTDAQGNFIIREVPRSEITVLASNGQQFLSQPAKAGAEIEIKFQESQPKPEDGMALRERLWNEMSGKDFYSLTAYWKIFGPERLLEAALRSDGVIKPDGTRDAKRLSRNFDTFLSLLVIKDPEQALAIATKLLHELPIPKSGTGARQLALLAARSDDADARAWAGEWFDTQKLRVSIQDATSDAVENALAVGTVGSLLGRPNAVAYRDMGLVLADGKFDVEDLERAFGWGRILWLAGPEQFEESIAEWSSPVQMMAVAGAVDSARTVEEANALLTRLANFANDAGVKQYEAKSAATNQGWRPGLAYALPQARNSALRLLIKTDLKAALDLLKKYPDSYEVQLPAFQVANAAFKAGQLDIARAAARFSLKDSEASRSNLARMALLTQSFDPDLSAELLASLKSLSKSGNAYSDSWRSIASYAYALQKSDPAAGRLLLEREWARRSISKGTSDYQENYQKQSLIWAMGSYDVPRALEWLKTMSNSDGNLTPVKANLLALLFADKQNRLLMTRNGVSD